MVKASLSQFIFSLLVGFPGIVREEFSHIRVFLQWFLTLKLVMQSIVILMELSFKCDKWGNIGIFV